MSNLFATALWYEEFGDPRTVVQKKKTVLAEPEFDQALVKMLTCPINPSDLIPITGAYSHRISPPMVCGYEGVGVIEWVGQSSVNLKVGDRVLVTRYSGTWSERIVLPNSHLVIIPDHIPDKIAARGYINPVTCELMLRKYPVKNKNILVTGGGTSCSMLLCQMGLSRGALSITVVNRSRKSKTIYERLGARQISDDLTEDLGKISTQVDITFDCVGGNLANYILGSQNLHARFVSYGLMSGKPVEDRRFASKIEGFFLRQEQKNYTLTEWTRVFESIWPILTTLELPNIKSFHFEDFRNSLEYYFSESRDCKPVLHF